MKPIGKNVTSFLIDNAATGELLRRKRERRGLKLNAVAEKMGFTAPYVSDLEKGKRNWTQALMDKYEETLKP